MNCKFKKLCATSIIALLAIGTIIPAFATDDSKINDLKNQQDKVNQQINSTKSDLKNVTIEKNKTLQDLSAINDNIDKVENEISAITKDIEETQSSIAYTEMELENKQRDYDGRMAIFSNRLKEMYMYGEVDYLDVLFQAEDISDFLARFEYLTYIADNDSKLLDEVVALKNGLQTDKANLEKQKQSLENKKQSQLDKANELEVASAQKAVVLGEIKAQESSLYDILDAMEEESKRIASSIVALQSTTGEAPKGQLVWPAPASKRITSPYGNRIHPIKKTNSFHTGVDIGAGSGTNIVAAASGKVIVSTYNSSYGNYVVIDHGGGMSTLYAHMSKRMVNVGDTVAAGSVIGLVGSTGLSTGPHLHFEVRINGNHTSPNSYLGI